MDLPDKDRALVDLLQRLDDAGYDFVTPTPATHARVLERGGLGADVRDILGWSVRFQRRDAAPWLVDLLERAGALRSDETGCKSAVRVSRLHGRLFLHSAFPTKAEDAVFLGPDSYRFADFIVRNLDPAQTGRIVDVGGGAGVGALVAAGQAPAAKVAMTDVNPNALRLARLNAAHAGLELERLEGPGLQPVQGSVDVVLANPPYIADTDQTYSDGGGLHGGQISVDWVRQAVGKLAKGGRVLLYTGSAIVRGGRDQLKAALSELAEAEGCSVSYGELDPDVFGEELGKPAYADVERISVVGCVVTR